MIASPLADHFEEHGSEAIKEVREKDPATYLRVIAGVLPKEVDITRRPLDELGDDELAELIERLRVGLLVGTPAEGKPPAKQTH